MPVCSYTRKPACKGGDGSPGNNAASVLSKPSFSGVAMPQTVSFKGYTVSGSARPAQGRWQVSFVIEKDSRLIQKAAFMLSACAVSAAEHAAILRGLQRVNEWEDD